MSVGEIRDYLGVDSLAFLDLDRLVAATGAAPEGFCTACFTGDYPVPVPDDDTKHVLETGAEAEPTEGEAELGAPLRFERPALRLPDAVVDAPRT
jgi:hypothetical protein